MLRIGPLVILWFLLELWLMIVIGSAVGALAVVLWTVLGFFIAMLLFQRARVHGFSGIQAVSQALNEASHVDDVHAGKQAMAKALGNALSTVVAGVFILIPGLMTDGLGLLLLLPPFRRWIGAPLKRFIPKTEGDHSRFHYRYQSGASSASTQDETIIDAEVVVDQPRSAIEDGSSKHSG